MINNILILSWSYFMKTPKLFTPIFLFLFLFVFFTTNLSAFCLSPFCPPIPSEIIVLRRGIVIDYDLPDGRNTLVAWWNESNDPDVDAGWRFFIDPTPGNRQ